VLVIKKVRDATVLSPFVQLVKWLITVSLFFPSNPFVSIQIEIHGLVFCFSQEKRMVVFVEHSVLDDPLLSNQPGFNMTRDKLMPFREGKDDLTDKIDFIVCLGGDGTLLYASSLFQVTKYLPNNNNNTKAFLSFLVECQGDKKCITIS
jgi:NAD+ kinase